MTAKEGTKPRKDIFYENDGQPCIKVYVVQRTPELDRKIFNRLAGYPVQIEETGGIRALPENRK